MQPSVDAHIGLIQPLRTQTVDHVTGFVGYPLLVHLLIGAREDAQDFTSARVDADRGADRVHHVDRLRLVELPGTRCKGIGFRGQRSDRAEVDHVALQLRGHGMFEIGRDLHVLATADRTELGYAGHLGREADAARAVDAPRHDGLDQRADIFVLDRAFVLLIAACIDAIGHRLVLQIAFAALIADRTVERMVDQQKFHHAFARLLHHRSLGIKNLRRPILVRWQILHAHGAGGLRFGNADDFDQAHPAISGNRQPLVEAEARDFRAGGFASLEQRVLRRDIDFFSINDNLGHAACSLGAPQCAVFHNFAPAISRQPKA